MGECGKRQWLRAFLRAVGSVAMLAVVAAAMPFGWMDAAHRWLGMGEMPQGPIVAYLARSTSAFYAMLGGLMWVLSFDVVRYRAVLRYLGWVIVAFAVGLGIIDFVEGMPSWWCAIEAPVNAAIGAVILLLGSGRGGGG